MLIHDFSTAALLRGTKQPTGRLQQLRCNFTKAWG